MTEPILIAFGIQAALQYVQAKLIGPEWLNIVVGALLAAVTAILARGRVKPTPPARDLPGSTTPPDPIPSVPPGPPRRSSLTSAPQTAPPG
jgi:hypothetical protein